MLICVLLIFGYATMQWAPTVWELGMPLEKFKSKNDKLTLRYTRIDSTVYTRYDELSIMDYRSYHFYTFIEGELVSVDMGKYRSKPQPQKIEIKIDDGNKTKEVPNPYK